MGGSIRGSFKIHLGQHVFESFGLTWVPMAERCTTLLMFWLILFWMHRRKIFLRI